LHSINPSYYTVVDVIVIAIVIAISSTSTISFVVKAFVIVKVLDHYSSVATIVMVIKRLGSYCGNLRMLIACLLLENLL
jgi:hypothetical protein